MEFLGGRTFFQILWQLVRRSIDFAGRSRRTDGWIWLAVGTLITLLTDHFLSEVAQYSDVAFYLWQAIYVLLLLPLVGWIPRRLHDIGVSGWWGLSIVPPIIAEYFLEFSSAGAIIILGSLASLAIFLWSPTKERNRYGPNPRASSKSFDELIIL